MNQKITIPNHPDHLWVDGEVENGIDVVREIIRFCYQKPFSKDYKLIVVQGIDQFTEEAQNALLKIIEEPPSATYFLLSYQNRAQILPTVLSRCSEIEVSAIQTIIGSVTCQKINVEESLITYPENFYNLHGLGDIFSFSQNLVKKYNRQQIIDLIEFWILQEMRLTNPKSKLLDILLDTKERLLSNTNIELTLNVFCIKYLIANNLL